jgi:hypothetical protein
VLPGSVSMVGEASETGGLEAGASGFAYRRAVAGLLVVGGDLADPGALADGVVTGPDDGELGSEARRGR